MYMDSLKGLTSKLISKMTPKEYTTYLMIKKRYETEIGGEINRNIEDLTLEEKMMASISKMVYSEKNCRVGVVYESYDKQTAVLGFKGTDPSNVDDMISNYHILFGKAKGCKKFIEAENLYMEVKDKYPCVKVTGHSLGGSQAIHISKLFGVQCWAWNPGQGISEDYLTNTRIYPNIKTYHIVGDLISEIAGLENPRGVYRFPSVSSKNPLVNHTMDNFLRYKGYNGDK